MQSSVRCLHRGAPRGFLLSSALPYSGAPAFSLFSRVPPGVLSSVHEGAQGAPRAFSTGPPGGPQGPMSSFGYRDVTREEKEKLVNGVFSSVAGNYIDAFLFILSSNACKIFFVYRGAPMFVYWGMALIIILSLLFIIIIVIIDALLLLVVVVVVVYSVLALMYHTYMSMNIFVNVDII